MTRRTFTFTPAVVTENGDPLYFVTAEGRLRPNPYPDPSGALGKTPSWAIQVTYFRARRMSEAHAIDERLHDLAGGLAKWVDIQRGIKARQTELRRLVAAEAFPDGTGDRSEPEKEAALDTFLRTFDHSVKDQIMELLAMVRRLEFLAGWPNLMVSVSVAATDGAPLPGWKDIANHDDLEPDAFAAIWNTHDRDRVRVETESGKAPPSAS